MGLTSFFKRGKKENNKKDDSSSHIIINTENCGGCGKCSIACPNNMFYMEDGVSKANDYGVCRNCNVCVAVCPNDCINVN